MNEFLRKILYLPEQQSTIAQDTDSLHYFVILVTMAGATLVALITGYFLVKYRETSEPGTGEPSHPGVRHKGGAPFWVEIGAIVGLLGLFLLWWVMGFRQYVRFRTVPADAVEVYVTGKKWMWIFTYPDGDRTQTALYVPVNRPVKLIMTSRDVIHSFFVPEFRIKQDVVPGRVTTVWFEAMEPGTYDILCTEYCGTGHSTMRGQVIALSEEEYEERMDNPSGIVLTGTTYIAGQFAQEVRGTRVTLAQMGERAATRYGCFRCHTMDGTPHIGPTWAQVYGSTITLQDGQNIVVDEAYLTESMMDPLIKVRRGFAPVMPSFQGFLTVGETGAIVEYIKSLRQVSIERSPSPVATDTQGTVSVDIPTGDEDVTPGSKPPQELLGPGGQPGGEPGGQNDR